MAGRHRKPSNTGRTVAKVAATGAVAGSATLALTGTASAHDWSGVAQCESGGNWNIDTGNGFSGGLQFTPSTWHAFGGTGSPANASRAEQVRVAENVLAVQGPGAWPVCGQYLRGGPSQAQTVSYDSTSAQPAANTSGGTYTVQSGDTLASIAASQGVSLSSLTSQVDNPNVIYPGQTLSV